MSALIGLGRRSITVGVLVGLVGFTAVPLSCGGDTERTFGDSDAGSGAEGGNDTGGSNMGGAGDTAGGSSGRGGTPNTGGASGTGTGNSGGVGAEGGNGAESGVGAEGGNGAEGGSPEGGTGGMSGSGGCTFVSAENCFNGRDDDCNGSTDAADSACASSTQCVPAATGFTMGVLMGSSATCPSAYANSMLDINRALNAGAGCTGCSCSATVSCSAQIFEYTDANVCMNDTALTGGTLQGTIGPVDMCLNGPSLIAGPGFRAGPFVTTNGACVPSGTATRSTPSWGGAAKFCGTQLVGTGCSPGNVSIPVTSERRCVVALGDQMCPTGYLPEQNPWYTGFDDQRSCGACSCGTQTPGDCTKTTQGNDVYAILYFGSSETCSAGQHRGVLSGGKDCTVLTSSGPHNSMAFNTTTAQPPKPPSCPGVSALSGALTPTGRYTVCCSL